VKTDELIDHAKSLVARAEGGMRFLGADLNFIDEIAKRLRAADELYAAVMDFTPGGLFKGPSMKKIARVYEAADAYRKACGAASEKD
jgi:hypothetical protein